MLNIFITLYILQESAGANAAWFVEKIWYILAVVILVGAALVVLLSKRREDVQLTETKRADALEKLLKTRDLELADATKKLDNKCEDFEAMEIEYKVLAGISIADLVKYWDERTTTLARLADAEEQIRIYEKRKGPNKRN